MVDYRSEIFDLNVFLVTSNVCLDPGLVVLEKNFNIVDILSGRDSTAHTGRYDSV